MTDRGAVGVPVLSSGYSDGDVPFTSEDDVARSMVVYTDQREKVADCRIRESKSSVDPYPLPVRLPTPLLMSPFNCKIASLGNLDYVRLAFPFIRSFSHQPSGYEWQRGASYCRRCKCMLRTAYRRLRFRFRDYQRWGLTAEGRRREGPRWLVTLEWQREALVSMSDVAR